MQPRTVNEVHLLGVDNLLHKRGVGPGAGQKPEPADLRLFLRARLAADAAEVPDLPDIAGPHLGIERWRRLRPELGALLHGPGLDQAAGALDRKRCVDVDTRLGERPVALLDVAAIIGPQRNDSGSGFLAQFHPIDLGVAVYYASEACKACLSLGLSSGNRLMRTSCAAAANGGLSGGSVICHQVELVGLVSWALRKWQRGGPLEVLE